MDRRMARRLTRGDKRAQGEAEHARSVSKNTQQTRERFKTRHPCEVELRTGSADLPEERPKSATQTEKLSTEFRFGRGGTRALWYTRHETHTTRERAPK